MTSSSVKVFLHKSGYTVGFALALSLLSMAVAIVIMLANSNIGIGVALAVTFALVVILSAVNKLWGLFPLRLSFALRSHMPRSC